MRDHADLAGAGNEVEQAILAVARCFNISVEEVEGMEKEEFTECMAVVTERNGSE
tara:strand:+ start:192 stop:356 length:165 start_codon:yes stop_codon:yes gene_type:complete